MTAPFMTDTTTNLTCGLMCQLCGDRQAGHSHDSVYAWAHHHLEDIHPGPYAYILQVLANTAIIITEADDALGEALERADAAEQQSTYYQHEFMTAAKDHERTAANLTRARAELRRHRGQPSPLRVSRAARADALIKQLHTIALTTTVPRSDLGRSLGFDVVWPHQC